MNKPGSQIAHVTLVACRIRGLISDRSEKGYIADREKLSVKEIRKQKKKARLKGRFRETPL